MVTVTLASQGNTPERITRQDGAKMREVVPDAAGRTIFLTRNGVLLEGVGPETVLQNGDQITLIANKQVGRS